MPKPYLNLLGQLSKKLFYYTVPNVETCAGFDRLAMNVNPQLLSNCGQNNACTQITCQAMGQLSIEVDAVSIMLDICKNNTAPGVFFELLRDERAVFNQRITSSTKINYSKVGTATIEAAIFLNSTNNSIGISVNHAQMLVIVYSIGIIFFSLLCNLGGSSDCQ